MTPEQFYIWNQQLQLSLETVALITAIRESPPVRRVRGRANNVTGRYPSPKMGRSIQFESQVEFLAIYGMERDLVRLRPEIGEPLLLPLAEFQNLRADGSIWEVSQASPSPMTSEIREAILHASPKAQQEANRRLREMLAYAREEPVTASMRSVRRWWHAYFGYLGTL